MRKVPHAVIRTHLQSNFNTPLSYRKLPPTSFSFYSHPLLFFFLHPPRLAEYLHCGSGVHAEDALSLSALQGHRPSIVVQGYLAHTKQHSSLGPP